jgi:hypothetical protein
METRSLATAGQRSRIVKRPVPVRGALQVMQERPLALPVHMIKLTGTREITAYFWMHPDEER